MTERQETIPERTPALLTKTEVQWLLGNANVSKSFEYKLRSGIRRKVQTLTELEIPLLMKEGYLSGCVDLTTGGKDLTANGKDDKWMGRDLNSRPPVCETGILTKLDHPSAFCRFIDYNLCPATCLR